MIDVKERLRTLMDERGMNIYVLSKRSGLSWNTIKNLFARDTTPTVSTLALICDGLGITLQQFFAEDKETIDLTAEQQHLINCWDRLSSRQKHSISEIIDLYLLAKE